MSLLAGLRERRSLGELSTELDTSRARVTVLEGVAATMLGCVRSLVLDIDEIGASQLQADLATTLEHIRGAAPSIDLAAIADERHHDTLEFAEREREYFARRDSELRRVIEVLTAGLAAVARGAVSYHDRLLDAGARFEAASKLADLVKMRAAITHEVFGLRAAVADRQAEESITTADLRSEIDRLRRTVEEARSEARTDALTTAANRAAVNDELARRCEMAATLDRGFAVLLADIDHFKQINDTYGHPVGDRVLMGFVEFARARVRSGDMLARWGGEEFMIVLPGANLRAAHDKAQTIVREIAAHTWTIAGDHRLGFTVSIGVTAWRAGDRPESLVERADAALYRAKRRGRNRATRA
ncbi:MAG TPA: GGDEF domain-containing protein [Kofleriaceae bacterium]|nr:GGDEF domain-containing protein [Kofleriaceae bacterium]